MGKQMGVGPGQARRSKVGYPGKIPRLAAGPQVKEHVRSSSEGLKSPKGSLSQFCTCSPRLRTVCRVVWWPFEHRGSRLPSASESQSPAFLSCWLSIGLLEGLGNAHLPTFQVALRTATPHVHSHS